MNDQPTKPKPKHATRIFWLIMIGLSILLLGMKILHVPYFETLQYRYVFAPIWAPMSFIGCCIILAILASIYFDLRKKP